MNKLYKDEEHKSGIYAYELNEETPSIKVYFVGGSYYLFEPSKTPKSTVLEMITLANAGKGLSGYIGKNKPKYKEKGKWYVR